MLSKVSQTQRQTLRDLICVRMEKTELTETDWWLSEAGVGMKKVGEVVNSTDFQLYD